MRFVHLLLCILACGLCVGCGTAPANETTSVLSEESARESSIPEISATDELSPSAPEGSAKRVAKDDASIQTANPDLPTRVIDGGTRINMHFGDTVLPGILNDTETSQALIAMLPYTVHLNSYSHDFCGVMPDELPYNDEDVHYGWLNGDIDYAIDAPYFTILHSDEEDSEQFGYQVNIGVLDCELDKIRSLSGSYDVRIELAE